MVLEAGPRRRLTLEDVLVIDADVHAHERPEELVPFCDPEWREPLANVAKVPARYLNQPAIGPAQPYTLPGSALPSPRGKAREEIVWDAAQMRRELDALNIDVGILFPDKFLKIAAIPNAAYAAALARAYNRWIAERWLDQPNDLYAVVMAVQQDPADAVREIERYAGHPRFVGVYLPTCQAYPLWGHRKFWPILAAAEEAGLPVMLHSVSGSSWVFPFNTSQMGTIAVHTASHVFAMMANLMSFMENGIPVRFPKLRICFTEAGLTWVPFLRMRLDKEYSENRQDLVDLIRIYDGEDTTIFASDWPHHDFDHPRSVFDLPIDGAYKRKLMGENALRLFGPKIQVPAKYGWQAAP